LSTNSRIVGIVDDEVDITELFHDALCRIAGISIVPFNDPIIALKHFTSNKEEYVLVISDLRMPGLNGLDLLKKMKRINPYVRTILMTAYEVESYKELKKSVKEDVINKFIQKPITISGLCIEVNNQIHAYELRWKEVRIRAEN